ncbi:MAG: hypothetical protein HY673_06790 [Chloroflexi bacterium]|nr:hypothetical protein [Chloroflexota bacterium]
MEITAGPESSLTKAQQQALALALQEWAAGCIMSYLVNLVAEQDRDDLKREMGKDRWRISHRGKDFLGAVRWQEVDVWMTNPEAGLALAVDPKHFQSQDSLRKNWKNGHNDLVAFATNLHERFPLCAVGGVICFPEWAASPQDLKQVHGICGRSIPRERPLNAYGKFEGFGLAVYGAAGDLLWPFLPGSAMEPSAAFQGLAKAVYWRTIALL